MARKLEVIIAGDSRGLERAFGSAARSTSAFGRTFQTLRTAAVAGGAALVAVAGYVGTKSVTAAISAQEANDKLSKAFENQRIQMTATSPAVLKLERGSRALGFTNADTREGLLRLINSGKGYSQSAGEIAVAQDLARVSGQS